VYHGSLFEYFQNDALDATPFLQHKKLISGPMTLGALLEDLSGFRVTGEMIGHFSSRLGEQPQ